MEYLENYRARMLSKENGVRERKVDDARRRAIKHFEDDPSFFSVNALEPDNPTVLVKRIRVINESVLKQLNPERVYSKFIDPHPEENMISGTMLFGLYDVDWIVTAVTGLGDVHQQAVLQKLNETVSLKTEAGTLAFPAVVNGVSRLGDGVLETNLFSMPDELVKIRVQNNMRTRVIVRNARLKISNKMYTLTKVDLYTDDGVINWIAKEDLLEKEDEEITVPVADVLVGAESITRARDYIYTAPEDGVVSWSISGATSDVVFIKAWDSSKATIRAEKTQLITFTLTATYADSSTVSKQIRLVSLL